MYRIRTPLSRSRRRLLIVSASEALLFPAVRHFSERGFHVDCTRSLERAMSLVVNAPYAAVLVQLGPMGVGRREWLAQLDDLLQHVSRGTIVMLTADNSPTVGERVIRCNLSAHVNKPVPLNELAEVITTMLRSTSEPSSAMNSRTGAPLVGEQSR